MMKTTAAPAPSPDAQDNLIEVENLKVHFPVRKGAIFEKIVGHVKAVDDVSFEIRRGEALGLVGESGCGKTTIGRCLLRLETPTDGRIQFEGHEIDSLSGSAALHYRRQVQAVFQDPFSSLNPRMSVGDIIAEPIRIHDRGMNFARRAQRVKELLDL